MLRLNEKEIVFDGLQAVGFKGNDYF